MTMNVYKPFMIIQRPYHEKEIVILHLMNPQA